MAFDYGSAIAGGVQAKTKPQAKSSSSGAPSLGSQALGLVKGFLPGIGHIVTDTAKGLGQLAADQRPGHDWDPNTQGTSLAHQTGESIRRYFPFVADLGAGMKRTGGNVVDLASTVAPGGQTLGKSHYGQAVKQGTILPTIVQDVGNAALVLGPVGKAIGAGAAGAAETAGAASAAAEAGAMAPGLAAKFADRAAAAQRLADITEKVARPAHVAAGAPAAPFVAAAKLTKWAGSPVLEAAGNTATGAALADRLATMRQGMNERAGLRELDQTGKRAAGEEARRGGLAQKATAKATSDLAKELGVDAADLTHARNMHVAGLTPVADILANVPEKFRPAMIHATFGVEQAPTEAALGLLRNPDVMSRAMEAYAPMGKLLSRAEQAKLKAGILSDEQTGHIPMPSAIERLAGDNADLAAKLEAGPAEVAPGMYKPALLNAERLNAGLKEAGLSKLGKAPTTMTELQALGIQPSYAPGGFENPSFPSGIGAPRNLQERRLVSSREKKTGNILKSDRRGAEQATRDMATMAQNETITAIKAKYVRTPEQLIKDEIAKIDAKPSSEITRADQLLRADLEDRILRGHDLGAIMRDNGYVSIGNKTETAIKGNSEFVPKTVLRTYKSLVEPVDKGPIAKAFDKGTTAWKHSQLALNPGWQVGNIVGNGAMAVVRGGMSPVELVKYAKTAREVLKQEGLTGEGILPARIHGTGGVAEMIRSMATGKEPKTPLGKLINKSYSANEVVDNTGKAAYYLWLKDKGVPEEQAIQQTLRVMGDFSNLSPLEQQVKRALPFYAWQRHTIRMGKDFLVNNPARAAGALQLSQVGRGNPSDPANQVDPTDPRSNMLGIGRNLFLPIGNMNPFTSSVQSPFLSPTGMASSLNPIIKAAAATGLNMNLQRGRMMSRPSGTGPGTGKFGPMSAKEDAYYLSQQAGPLARALTGGILGDKVRYDQGSVMTSRGKALDAEGGRLQGGTRPLGLPLPVFMNETRVEKTLKDKAAQAKKAKKKK